MGKKQVEIVKRSGERVKFLLNKLCSSLKRTGASRADIEQVTDKIRDEFKVYQPKKYTIERIHY